MAYWTTIIESVCHDVSVAEDLSWAALTGLQAYHYLNTLINIIINSVDKP